MRNLILKIVVSILLITTVVLTLVLSNRNEAKSGEIYHINIVISNQTEIIKDDNYEINSDVTLFNSVTLTTDETCITNAGSGNKNIVVTAYGIQTEGITESTQSAIWALFNS